MHANIMKPFNSLCRLCPDLTNTSVCKTAELKAFLPHLNIIIVSSSVLRFRVISVNSMVSVLDADPGLETSVFTLYAEAGGLHAAHAWLLLRAPLDSGSPLNHSVLIHESKETAGKHELDSKLLLLKQQKHQ